MPQQFSPSHRTIISIPDPASLRGTFLEEEPGATYGESLARHRCCLVIAQTVLHERCDTFGERTLMASITAARIEAYVIERQGEDYANATINRDLALLKRMYTLAMKDGRLFARPRIEMLPEDNARQGFFEPEQFADVLAHLSAHLRPIVTFAYNTGWRRSEVLTRQWRHVDFEAETIRLDPGETKNRKPRTIHFDEWTDLRQLLKDPRALTGRLERERDAIIPWVFHRDGTRIVSYYTAWKNRVPQSRRARAQAARLSTDGGA